MTVNVGRWRRMDAELSELSEARSSGDPARCPDALVRALDSFNYLWNGYHAHMRAVHVRPPNYSEDSAVSGQSGGEVAAALVFARGEMTHDGLVDFGELADVFSDTFSDLFGVWIWQPYLETRGMNYPHRMGWYSEHIEGQEVLAPFLRALEWLEAQPGGERLAITFQEARQIVRKAHHDTGETGLQEYVVAHYGGQDATDYLIVHGERGSIDDVTLPNGEPYDGIIGEPVTLVNKTTGRIQDVGHLLMFDRLDRMESIGTWPPGMGVGR